MEAVDHIIWGGYLLAMDGQEPIAEGALAVKGDKIAAVGPYEEIKRRYFSESVIGGPERAVMPGLINTHTHAAMVLMRGMADDLPLREWLEGHIWPTENKWLSPEFIRDAVKLAAIEMLRAGVTAFNDMYFFEEVAAQAVRETGMRAVLGAGIMDMPTKTTSGAEDCLRNAERFVKEWKGDRLISPALAPHSAYACGPDTLKKTRDMARKYGVPCHIHLSETKWEVGETIKSYGENPVKYLDGLGFLDDKVLAAHCVWVDGEEIDILSRRGVSVSHCVESNLKLASGIAPVPRMLRAGVRVTFGTDGAASNNDLDVLSEIQTAAKLHKAVSGDPTALDAKTALTMATRWAAEALGLDSGCLQPGRTADIAVVNLRRPHLVPVYNIYSHLVYAAKSSDVETVMVDGKIIMDGGRILTADEDEVISRAEKWGRRIAKE